MAIRDRRISQLSIVVGELLYSANVSGHHYAQYYIDLSNPRCKIGADDRLQLEDLLRPEVFASCPLINVNDVLRVVDRSRHIDIDLTCTSKHGAGAIFEPRGVLAAADVKAINRIVTDAKEAQSAELNAAFSAEQAKMTKGAA